MPNTWMWTDTLLRPTASVVSAGSTASVTVAALSRRTQVPVQHLCILLLFNQVVFAFPLRRSHYLFQRQLVPTMDKYSKLPLPPDTNAIPVRISPDADVVDALPNPRFRSHMLPIFTSQWEKEQELAGEWSLSGSFVPHRSSTLLLCTHGQRARSPLPWRNSKWTACIYLALLPLFYLCLERVISPWLCDTCSALPPGSRYLG